MTPERKDSNPSPAGPSPDAVRMAQFAMRGLEGPPEWDADRERLLEAVKDEIQNQAELDASERERYEEARRELEKRDERYE